MKAAYATLEFTNRACDERQDAHADTKSGYT